MRLPRNAFLSLLSPALLLAGLVLCAPLPAAEAPPGRSVVPAEALAPSRDLEALRLRLDELSSALEERQDAQARQLSRNAEAIVQLQAARERGDAAQSRAQAAFEALRQRQDGFDAQAKALELGAARAAVDVAARDRRIDNAVKELAALRADLGSAQDSLQGGLKDVQAARAELKERGETLASLTDLLSAMKRELDSNNEELVELRLAVKNASTPAPARVGSTAWWDRALQWKYLPAVAVGLSAVAVGWAASR